MAGFAIASLDGLACGEIDLAPARTTAFAEIVEAAERLARPL